MAAEDMEYVDSMDIFKQLMPFQTKFDLFNIADSLHINTTGIPPRAGPYARLLHNMLERRPYAEGPSFLESELGVRQHEPRGRLNPTEHAILLVDQGRRRLNELLLILHAQPLSLNEHDYMRLYSKKEMKALAMVLGRRHSGNKSALARELISWRKQVTGWP